MKKILLPLVALMLSMVACQKDNEGILTLKMEKYASDAKVHLNDDNYAVWDNGDEIWINGDRKTVTINGTTATISVEEADAYTAIYPYEWAGNNTITYPAEQTYRANGIDAPMAAYCGASDNSLSFRNLGSLLAVNVSGVSKVMKIEVVADGNTLINGTASIDFSGERPVLGTFSNGTNTIILNCPNGVIVPTEGKTFYIAMPPVSAKLSIRVYGTDYYYSKSQISSFSMEANHGYNVPFNTNELSAVPLGTFHVSATKVVKFAPGNLRYTSSAANHWSFCSNQYEYNSANLGSNGVWDYFGWSSDGASINYGMSSSTSKPDYYGNFVDWGAAVNAQGNLGTGWRTLSKDEWVYIFNTRDGATIDGTSGRRYAFAKVNSTCGIILFPDGAFVKPSNVTTMPTTYNSGLSWNSAPGYSTTEWSGFESAGCVFLPAAGRRSGTSIVYNNSYGYYWSSTPNGDDYAYFLDFFDNYCNPKKDGYRFYGVSVRLVQDQN